MTTEHAATRPLLLFAILLFVASSAFPQVESSPVDTLNGETLIEDAAIEAQSDTQGASAELWEALTTPTTGDYVRVRFSSRRMEEEDATVHDYTFSRVRRGPLEATVLYRKQMTEPGIRHVKGAAAWMMSPRTRLYLGSLRMDAGLGWTVAGSPAWAFNADPSAPFRVSSRGLNANTSSESFRGFLGGGISTSVRLSGSDTPSRVDVWGGRQEFPARTSYDSPEALALAGSFSPPPYDYSHPANLTAHAILAGARAVFPLPGDAGNVEVIHSEMRLEESLSQRWPISRFKNLDTPLLSTGLAFRAETRGLHVRGEASYQDENAWAAQVAGFRAWEKAGRFTVNGWYVSRDFCYATARPYLPFGATAWNVNGLMAGWEKRRLLIDYVALTTAWQFQHLPKPAPNRGQYQYANGIWLTLRQHLGEAYQLDVRTWYRGEHWNASPMYPDGAADGRRSLRIALIHDNGFNRTTLRIQRIVTNGSGGNGTLGGIEWRLPWGEPLGFAVAATYLRTTGTHAGVTVIEPVGPGMLPVVTLTGEHIRLASRLDGRLLPGMVLWASAVADQMSAEEGNPFSSSRTTLYANIGLDWRPGI